MVTSGMGQLRDCEIMCFSLKHFTNQFSLYPKHEYEIVWFNLSVHQSFINGKHFPLEKMGLNSHRYFLPLTDFPRLSVDRSQMPCGQAGLPPLYLSTLTYGAGSVGCVLLEESDDLSFLSWRAATADHRRTLTRQLHKLVLIVPQTHL